MAADSTLTVSMFVNESKVIADDNIHSFNRKLETDLNDDWIQHGGIFAVGNQFAVNVIRIDPQYKELAKRTFKLASRQLTEMEQM